VKSDYNFIAKQQLNKHIPAAMNTRATKVKRYFLCRVRDTTAAMQWRGKHASTIEMSSAWSVQNGYENDFSKSRFNINKIVNY
jgi:hypothetical protein